MGKKLGLLLIFIMMGLLVVGVCYSSTENNVSFESKNDQRGEGVLKPVYIGTNEALSKNQAKAVVLRYRTKAFEQPDKNGQIVNIFGPDTVIALLGEMGNFYKVKLYEGLTAWIVKDSVKEFLTEDEVNRFNNREKINPAKITKSFYIDYADYRPDRASMRSKDNYYKLKINLKASETAQWLIGMLDGNNIIVDKFRSEGNKINYIWENTLIKSGVYSIKIIAINKNGKKDSIFWEKAIEIDNDPFKPFAKLSDSLVNSKETKGHSPMVSLVFNKEPYLSEVHIIDEYGNYVVGYINDNPINKINSDDRMKYSIEWADATDYGNGIFYFYFIFEDEFRTKDSLKVGPVIVDIPGNELKKENKSQFYLYSPRRFSHSVSSSPTIVWTDKRELRVEKYQILLKLSDNNEWDIAKDNISPDIKMIQIGPLKDGLYSVKVRSIEKNGKRNDTDIEELGIGNKKYYD